MTRTVVPPGPPQEWHYKNHLEACYCISGKAILTNVDSGDQWSIEPDTVYAPDDHDNHTLEAIEETVLICVFNPPLTGAEVHDEENSYPLTHKSPVYGVRPVPIEKVVANDYNPNRVAPPEMELLETSIWEDGYTQPIVTFYDEVEDKYVVVDGFHRYLILKDTERIRSRENGMLPVVVIDKDMSDRIASTIRHNRARGTHNIELMSVIVAELVEMGKGDRWICKHIGMSLDELLRLKQITGLAALFANRDFSDSWDAELSPEGEDALFEDEQQVAV
jgi:ParB-like chromosome segregation protein Spo0J